VTPRTLYLPARYNGVFCRECVRDVLNPSPSKRVKLAPDGEPVEDDLAVSRKLDAYLRTRPKEPAFCGRGRPARKGPALRHAPADRVIQRWRYFSRKDVIRINSQKAFGGERGKVWRLLTDGATIAEVLDKGKAAGLDEARVVAVLRKFLRVYGALRIEWPAAVA
jgi:hypothetical protein